VQLQNGAVGEHDEVCGDLEVALGIEAAREAGLVQHDRVDLAGP